jgi:hypothetical protein
MKLSITFTYHYTIFLGIALLLTPATFIRPCEKINEIRIEKNKEQPVATGNPSELLHGELLFRY